MSVINSLLPPLRPSLQFNRSYMHQSLLRGALCLAAFASVMSAQSIAVLTGAQGTATSFPVFPSTLQGPVTTVNGLPPGTFQLIAKPDGSKYYVLSSTIGLTVLDRNLT